MPRALRVRAAGSPPAGGSSGADVAWLEHVWGHVPPPLQIRVLVELHDVVYDGFEKLGHPCDLSRG